MFWILSSFLWCNNFIDNSAIVACEKLAADLINTSHIVRAILIVGNFEFKIWIIFNSYTVYEMGPWYTCQYQAETYNDLRVITWGNRLKFIHYNDVIMGAMASQITSLTTVYSTVYSGAHQRKHQSSASLAFVRGIHRWPVNSLHKWPVTRKMFEFDDVIMSSWNKMATMSQTIPSRTFFWVKVSTITYRYCFFASLGREELETRYIT